MELFGAYIKQYKRIILAYALFAAVFAASFALYHLPLKAVVYPATICALLGLAFMTVGYIKAMKRHGKLSEIKKLTAEMISELPEPERIDDADYAEIIENLRSEVSSLKNEASLKYQDMVDYYTVWAHQIKTPIAAMRLTLQNEDTPLSRTLMGDLNRIERYVEMVLAFLRLDSDSTDYVFKTHEVDDIVKQAVKKFASEFIGRRISLEYEPIEESVVTDEKWLGFVLEQVLSNALKYTREGSVRIYMTEDKRLCVADTGIGIAPEDLPRIFEKGYTGHNGRRDMRASGLGLYLCKRICKNLGADISAVSEPDKGTTVMIDLKQYNLKKE